MDKFRRYFQFFLVVIAAGSIFPLIYLRQSYQATILEVFNMELEQLNSMYTALGWAFVIGYFPSGWLADRFSAKKLLALSLLVVGLAGLWYAQIPSYNVVRIIFIIWGIFSVFTFWAAHLKIVKLLSTKEDEGKFFGILDGGRGVVEALLASIAVIIFGIFVGNNADAITLAAKEQGLIAVIYLYAITLIILSVLIAIFLKTDDNKVEKDSEDVLTEKLSITESSKLVFANKFVFLFGGIIATGYTLFWTVYYFSGFLETNIKLDALLVGQIAVIILWMRPIGGVIGGIIADKVGKTKTLFLAMFLAISSLIIVSILPYSAPQFLFIAMFIFCGLMLYTIRGLYWSLLGDCNFSDKILGLAIGVVSFLGYLPDIIIPKVNTILFATFGDNKGYNGYFITSAIVGILGLLLIIRFNTLLKKENSSL